MARRSPPITALALALVVLCARCAAAAAAPAPAPAAPVLPPLPSWARGPESTGPGAWKPFSIKQAGENKEVVQKANAAKQQFDFLLYGDSITQLIKRNGVFPSFFNNNSAALGVSGNDIEDLAWRLMTAHGAENPAIPPKVVAILIGLNNMQAGQKVVEILRKLDYLLAWAQAAWPHTKIMLVSLLPNAKYNTGALNKQYVALAAKRRLAWALCGQDINARDKAQLYDGTHPTVAAQRKLLSCLAQHVAALAAEKAGR